MALIQEDFNISDDVYEFDFPDFNLDDDLPSCHEIDSDLDRVDDKLLALVCTHQLNEEEKRLDNSAVVDADEVVQTESGEIGMSGTDLRMVDEIYILPPPPQLTYESHDAAEAAIHQWTLEHHYNVSRRRVRYLPGTKIVWARNYECDRAGWPKCTQHLVGSERQRPMRGSKRCGCPMRLKMCAVSKSDIEGPWKIVHTRDNSEVHNHPAVDDVRVHAAHRQRAAAGLSLTQQSMEETIVGQTAAGIPVAKIRAAILHSTPGSLVLPKDIGNLKMRARKQAMATQTPLEALFSLLNNHKFFFRYEINPTTNELLYLLWPHPATLRLYKLHCDVLIMDGTFKTNKYDLPLVNVIAMTGMNTVLPVAQCFLPGQKDNDYTWFLLRFRELIDEHAIQLPSVNLTDRELAVMNALDSMFPEVPSLVCRWHLNQNVLAKVRSVLGQIQVENPLPGQDKWENTWQTEVFMSFVYSAVEASTEHDFELQCVILRDLSPVLAAYLEAHWWKYKTKIVRCWTNKNKHFEYRDTSAVEGTHAQCKRWLQDSNGDLYTVFTRLLPWWLSSASAVSIRAARDATILPYLFQNDRYTQVGRVITVWALRATDELWEEAIQMLTGAKPYRRCTGVFRIVNGRPCVHELICIIQSNGRTKLLPTMYDPHWWIYRDRMEYWRPRILEPASLRTKRRKAQSHRANHGASGTARDPTLAERVDRNNPAPAPSFMRGMTNHLITSSSQTSIHIQAITDGGILPSNGLLHVTTAYQQDGLRVDPSLAGPYQTYHAHPRS